MEINNIKGITISQISETLNLHPGTVKSALRHHDIKPITYLGQVGIYPESAFRVIQERNTSTGRPAKPWKPKGAEMVSK
jgi:IS30 family transposase